jgi:hypothetical protein
MAPSFAMAFIFDLINSSRSPSPIKPPSRGEVTLINCGLMPSFLLGFCFPVSSFRPPSVVKYHAFVDNDREGAGIALLLHPLGLGNQIAFVESFLCLLGPASLES